jgi:hypothetical protein
MYEQLVRKFGPAKTWNGTAPTDRAAYDVWCARFAEQIGASSADAVQIQINFVLQKAGNLDPSQSSCWIKNLAAAYWAGFTDASHFSYVCFDRRPMSGGGERDRVYVSEVRRA